MTSRQYPPPDFVIAGAPKCGTTALFRYLEQHKAIFMPERKEPHYFGNDLPQWHRKYQTLQDYVAIFGDARPDQLCGEASVLYIYSNMALDELLKHNGDVKCIAIVRNPVDHFLSWHNQSYKRQDECYADPEEAWRAQERRLHGDDIPPGCRHPELLQYKRVSTLGTRLRRFVDKVPAGQRYIGLYDDFAADPQAFTNEVLVFLGLSPLDDITVGHINKRAVPRFPGIERLVRNPPSSLGRLQRALRGPLHRFGIHPVSFIRRFNNKSHYIDISPSFHRELVDAFAPEIETIEAITGRDLSHWRA